MLNGTLLEHQAGEWSMNRRYPLFFLALLGILACYILGANYIEQRMLQEHEALFNEQQSIQVQLSVQAIENDFHHRLDELRLMARGLLPLLQDVDGMLASVGPSLYGQPFDRADFPAIGLFLTPGQPLLMAGKAELVELLADWTDDSWEMTAAADDYVLLPSVRVDGHNWGVLLLPLRSDEGEFQGVLGAVIDIDRMLGVYVAPIRYGQYGAAWAADQDGVVLYDHETEIIGQSVADLHVGYPELQAIDQRMQTEPRGQGEYAFTNTRGGEVERKLVAWDTVQIGDLRISIALSSPATEINAYLASYRIASFLMGVLLAIGLIAAGALMLYVSQTSLQSEIDSRTEELHQYNRAMLALNSTMITITSVLDLDDILPRMIEAAEDVFPQSYAVTVQLSDNAAETSQTIFASPEVAENNKNIQFRPGFGIAGHAIASALVINVPDIQADDRFVPGETPVKFRSLLVAPLISRSRVWGTLSIEGLEVDAFNADDEVLANLLARQVGTAIENAQLYHAEKKQRETADILRDIGIAFTGSLRQEDVLKQVLAQVERILPFDAAAVWLAEEDGSYRRFVGVGYEKFGLPDNERMTRWYPEESPILRKVGTSTGALVISDVRQEPDWLYLEEYSWLRSWVGAPIVVRGDLIGIFCLDHSEPKYYGEEHRGILEVLSNQVSIAVENALLFEQVQHYALGLQEQVMAATAEIRTQQERTEAILRNIGDAVVIGNLQGRILYINDSFQRLLGWAEQDVLNQPVRTFLHTSTPRRVMQVAGPGGQEARIMAGRAGAETSGWAGDPAGSLRCAASPAWRRNRRVYRQSAPLWGGARAGAYEGRLHDAGDTSTTHAIDQPQAASAFAAPVSRRSRTKPTVF
jgi:GAF domain-containing protein